MQIRTQLALGGGFLVCAVLILGHVYVGGGADPTMPTRRLEDPLFVLAAVALGAAAGFGAGRSLERPLRSLTRAVRAAETAAAAGQGGRLTPTPDSAAGEVVDLYRAVHELHARQAQAAAGLLDENRRLQVILDSITEGLLVTDMGGRIVTANRALRELFDVTRPLAGRLPVEVVRNGAVDDAIERVLAGGAAVSCEITVAGQRSLDVHVAPIAGPGAGGKAAGTVTVFYEITRLRRLERMRKDFVANVSHELRTPLTAIKGCAETLIDGALRDPAAAARFVGVIADHAERLTELLTDLLDLSRLESDRIQLARAAVPVRRLYDTAADAVQRVAADRRIHVAAELPDGVTVDCDRKLIEQALINLVDNAVKYTPEGGHVIVRARQVTRRQALLELAGRRWTGGGVESVGDEAGEAPVVVLEVVDDGIGIPANEVERVFERFYRVDKGRSRGMGGTGLGLSIVRHTVELHGERVFVDSDLGKGSVFGFTLPSV